MKSTDRFALSAFLILLFFGGLSVSYAMERVHGVVHLDTNIGGGVLSPEEMIRKVKEAGLKVAVITDKDNQRVEYGVSPLRKIIRRVEERKSILTYGAENYLGMIESIAKKNPDMTIIAGVEAVPFYYWEGDYFSGNLRLVNFHKHLLIIGMEKPEYLRGIPSVGRNNYPVFDMRCLPNMWPVLLIAAGLWLTLYKGEKLIKLQLFYIKKKSRPYIAAGIVILFVGILFTINNIPFCSPIYDQYHGDRGALPYQNLIDYTEKKGGMIFWSHTDVEAKHKLDGIEIYTPPYYGELLRTYNYTGFAVLVEGMKFTGRPGGIWDAALKQYINGQRRKPVWAIGELDYKEGSWMGETQTVFLVNKNSKADILDAMREGRMYAVYGESKPIVEAFQIWDNKRGIWTEMGGIATVDAKVRLKLKVRLPEGEKKNTVLRLIREGVVIKEIYMDDTLDIELTDEYFKAGAKTYYRIDIDSRLISNPIFVKMEKNP